MMSWLETMHVLSFTPKFMVRMAADTLCESCSIPRGTSPHVKSAPLFKELSKNAAEMTGELNLVDSWLAPCKIETVPRSKDRVAEDMDDCCSAYRYSPRGKFAPSFPAVLIRAPVCVTL